MVIEEPNTLTEGIRTRIEKICQGRFFDRVVAGRLINMSAFIALVLYAIFAIVGTATGVTWAADVSIALVSGYILIGFFVFRNQSEVLVINAYRADRPSFFRRTRDDWIVEIVVMFIGLLLGFLIGHPTK